MAEEKKTTLEEAAGLYLDNHKPLTRYNWGDLEEAFIAGAKWQKQQMMKDAVEGKIYGYDDGSFELIASWLDMPKSPIFKDGDKVKIVIVKSDETDIH
jgi:hypothetical protein